MVELDGVTYYVDTIDMQLTASNFTLTRQYTGNYYDPAYLKRHASFKVKRLIFGRLSIHLKALKCLRSETIIKRCNYNAI